MLILGAEAEEFRRRERTSSTGRELDVPAVNIKAVQVPKIARANGRVEQHAILGPERSSGPALANDLEVSFATANPVEEDRVDLKPDARDEAAAAKIVADHSAESGLTESVGEGLVEPRDWTDMQIRSSRASCWLDRRVTTGATVV